VSPRLRSTAKLTHELAHRGQWRDVYRCVWTLENDDLFELVIFGVLKPKTKLSNKAC